MTTAYRVTERDFQIIMDGGWWNYVSPKDQPMFVITRNPNACRFGGPNQCCVPGNCECWASGPDEVTLQRWKALGYGMARREQPHGTAQPSERPRPHPLQGE